jgi:hypothetical protein
MVVPPTARLLAIPTEDRRVQLEGVPEQNRWHGGKRQPDQGLRHLGGPSIREALKESPQRIRGRDPEQPQRPWQQRIAAIARQMFNPFGAEG